MATDDEGAGGSIYFDKTENAVREFITEVWRGKSEPIAPHPCPLRLEEVVKRLHDSGINIGLQGLFDHGFRVWIGDPVNGIRATAHMGMEDNARTVEGRIARWLHEKSLSLYPDSSYALHFRR